MAGAGKSLQMCLRIPAVRRANHKVRLNRNDAVRSAPVLQPVGLRKHDAHKLSMNDFDFPRRCFDGLKRPIFGEKCLSPTGWRQPRSAASKMIWATRPQVAPVERRIDFSLLSLEII